ncbi:alpha/beta fold hydrolase [Paractinoplanes maris]|uniref:alpha/beta fold hydrolase n=1 Tax=Paractinoplanes maris TaxID=1734446 RepID=UPI0020225006|nr:alpha/beta hydrolase [Actinoplanes maris]
MTITRRGRRIAAAVATGLLLGAGTLTSSLSSAAAAPAQSGSGRPTIVLVHGAWADGSSWSGEISRLQRRGYTVDVAPQPGRGPAEDSAYLRDYLAAVTGPIVLVGHSYGGFVITGVATGNPNVKALVYVDAFAPDQGESIGSLTGGSGSVLEPALTDPARVFRLTGYPGAPAGAGDSYVLPAIFASEFAGDLPRDQAAVLAATQTPFATTAFAEPSSAPAWKTVPSWAVISRQDKVIPPAAQTLMAARAHARVTRINGSHLSLISHPAEVTDVILTAATH